MALFFSLYIIFFIFSIILHEVMHGVVALKFGDTTAQRAGRLTLNPIPHIDLIGSILVPGILIFGVMQGINPGFIIGWAKPVPINPLNFTNMRKGEFFVAAAGVTANFVLAITASLILHAFNSFNSGPSVFLPLLLAIGRLNLLLGVFNMLPIPPLDGSKMLLSQLPYHLAKEYEKLERYGFIILLLLLVVPMGSSTILETVLMFFVNFLSKILGF